jgi:hypothetical protein
MKKDREFEDILNECLDRVLRGQTIEQCLRDYPDYASALEPMLRMAVRAKRATNIYPRPEFKDRARHQFQEAIREMEPVKEREPIGRSFFPRLKPVWIAVTAFVAILIIGGGMVMAANGALPDSPLYAVKLATETVWLAFTPSEIGKAELYAKFADRRVDEIIQMAEKGEAEYVEKAAENLKHQLVAIASLDFGEGGGTIESSAGEQMLSAQAEPPGSDGEPASEEDGARTPEDTNATAILVPAPSAVEPAEDQPPVLAVRPQETEKAQVGTDDTALTDNMTERTYDSSDTDENLGREDKLKELLLRQAMENPEALRKALENAPESLRDILNWAIEVAGEGYEEAVSNVSNLK